MNDLVFIVLQHKGRSIVGQGRGGGEQINGWTEKTEQGSFCLGQKILGFDGDIRKNFISRSGFKDPIL